MKVSVVISVRKITGYFRQAIPYFRKQTFKDFEIVVVSEANETEKFPRTRIIKVDEMSPAQKRNTGVKNAKGEIIAFIDDDAYPKADWLENALKNFKDDSIVAVGGPGLVPQEATFFQRLSSKTYELSSEETGGRYRIGKKREVDVWPTFNLFVRKDAFARIGGFDPGSWGAEDDELCHNLKKGGKKVISDPKVVVYHHPRKTLKGHLKQTFNYGFYKAKFIRKHKEASRFLFFIPSLFTLWLVFGAIDAVILQPFRIIYFSSLLLYLLYILMLEIKLASIKMAVPFAFMTFLSHLAYGLGFIKGFVF